MTEATKIQHADFRGIIPIRKLQLMLLLKVFSTVPMALFTILVRSKNASIFTPSGKVFGFLLFLFYFFNDFV